MAQNFDWTVSAQHYVDVYQHALRKKLAAPA
jgi:glycogen synthase